MATHYPSIVETYIWIAILTLRVSKRIYNIVRCINDDKLKYRYTQLQWDTIFSENSVDRLNSQNWYYNSLSQVSANFELFFMLVVLHIFIILYLDCICIKYMF